MGTMGEIAFGVRVSELAWESLRERACVRELAWDHLRGTACVWCGGGGVGARTGAGSEGVGVERGAVR